MYKRIGAYDAITAFVHDLMPRLRNDPTLWVYWKGISDDSAQRGDKLLIDFIAGAFEGPVYYAGRDMKISHKGLGITEAEWGIFMPFTSPRRSIALACSRARRKSFCSAPTV